MGIDFKRGLEHADSKGVVDFLHQHSYWAGGRPIGTILRSLENSLCVSGWTDGRQVAFARIVTDYATMYYLADVFVLPEMQGKGIGHLLMEYIHSQPDLHGLRGILTTQTAHDFYSGFGYTQNNPVVRERILVRMEGETPGPE